MIVVKVAKSSRACAGVVALLLLALTGTGLVRAQVSSLLPTQKPAAASQVANAVDPLGRETPRGTLIGFIRAAQDESERAIEYFQPPP
jgi:hypothetical protein